MHNYEHLALWQRGLALASQLQRRSRDVAHWSDRALLTQITRAAVSIPANVAEGAQRGTDREFARFLAIAMGSAAELHSLLHLAAQAGVLAANDARQLAFEAVQLRRMASGLRARALGLRGRQRTIESDRTPQKHKPPEP